MNRLAIKMLLGDHSKYLMLISGITFATLLMANSASLFCGIMSWTYATVQNARAPIWVSDRMVEQVNETKPLRDTDVHLVRSVDGVDWAVPFYQGLTQARLLDGSFQLVTLIGIDPTTMIGAPETLVAGNLEDLRLPDTVIIDEFGVERLSEKNKRPIVIGDVFEMNDRTARIVGICKSARSFTGGPYVFTTYDRAIRDYNPAQRRLLSYVLAAPQAGVSAKVVAERIRETVGLRAYTENEFEWSTMEWYFRNTGIPINVGTLVAIGFFVGTVISGQTFYSFVIENSRNLGALKAMGTSNFKLFQMLILQSFSVGLIGFGIGIGIVSLNGNFAMRTGKIPFLMVWQVPASVLAAVLFISVMASILGMLKIGRIDPANVFR